MKLRSKIILNFVSAILLLGLVGCAGSSSSGTEVSVAGSWRGSWQSSLGQRGSLSGSFTQTGPTFNGQITIADSPCFATETVSGTLSNTSIEIGSASGGILFRGSVSDSRISGTYNVSGTICAGDAGKFELLKN